MTRASLEKALGYRFRDPTKLDQALTHRSSAHEAGAPAEFVSYERLEFLGDSLLGFLVSERLMDEDPGADEGTLTRRRQAIVSTDALASASRRLGLGAALILGRGEAATGGRDKSSLLADAFESVLAAVYRDGGLRAARAFVRRHMKAEIQDASRRSPAFADPKTRLQELIQARWRLTPRYRIVSLTGPAHAKEFVAEVLLGDAATGRGVGFSRKEAEQAAARDALAALSHDEPGGRP